MEEKKEVLEKVKEQTETLIDGILEDGIKPENIELLYKMIDIHKDIANEEYWKMKEEKYMRYSRGYGNSYGEEMGNYGRRGRYSARGYDTKYRGEEVMGDMHESFQAYSEGKEAYGRGNYGAKQDTMKSLDYMLQSVVEFVEMLKQDASSQEEVDLIKKYTHKISEM